MGIYVSVPFCPVQMEAKRPFHAQKIETGRGGGRRRSSDGKCRQLFQLQLARKRRLESLRKPKEASLYPSDCIWRRTESIGTLRSIDCRQWTLIPVGPRSQNSPEIEERQQITALKDFRRRQQYKTIDSSRRVNELAFHSYTSPNHAHHYQLYVCAYGTEMERLE